MAGSGRGEAIRTAVSATLHCLIGCAVGEVLGMVVSTAIGFAGAASIALSIGLAFAFGYGLSMRAVLASGLALGRATRVAVAADTVSIAAMELADNAFIAAVPGALAAGLTSALFWWSLCASLAIAFVVTVPVNAWLIGRGRGHAAMHAHHAHHGEHGEHGERPGARRAQPDRRDSGQPSAA